MYHILQYDKIYSYLFGNTQLEEIGDKEEIKVFLNEDCKDFLKVLNSLDPNMASQLLVKVKTDYWNLILREES